MRAPRAFLGSPHDARRWLAALAVLAAALTHGARGEGGSGGGSGTMSGGSGGSGKEPAPAPAPTSAAPHASDQAKAAALDKTAAELEAAGLPEQAAQLRQQAEELRKREPAVAIKSAVGLMEGAPDDSGGNPDDEGAGGSAEAADEEDEGGSGGSGGSGEDAGAASDPDFCNGMPTAMYMEGFVSVFGSSRAKRHCAVFLYSALVLDTPGKFFLGLLGAAGLGALTELAMALKRREEQRGRLRTLGQALWQACTLTLGYCDMLLVMVYNVELAAAVVAGLCLGRACLSYLAWPPQAIVESEDSESGISSQMRDPLYGSSRKRNGGTARGGSTPCCVAE